MKTIIGEYNENGYQILYQNGNVLYSAGNNPKDSCLYSPMSRLTLSKIRSFCISTAKEIAKENNARYGGVERHDLEIA